MITIGVLLVNDWPPVVVIAAAFHSKMPQLVICVSNQLVPFAGALDGASELGSSTPRSMSARVTYTLLLTPSSEYAACRPYSFSSPPCTGLLFASTWKIGSPKVSDNSRCDVSKKGLPAFAAVVPDATPVPLPFVLFCAVATKIIGTVPGSAGV